MNKRGGFFSLVLLLIALSVGAAITAGNIPIERVDEISASFVNITQSVDFNFNESELAPELGNALDYYVTGLVRAYGELTSWVMKYTAQNPQIPYKLLLYLFLLAIAAPILIFVFKFFIIVFLLIREYFQSRKEKKLIKSYKGGKSK